MWSIYGAQNHECVRTFTLYEACERLLCRVGLGLGNWGEGELAVLERATGLCRDEALQLVFVLIFSSFELDNDQPADGGDGASSRSLQRGGRRWWWRGEAVTC